MDTKFAPPTRKEHEAREPNMSVSLLPEQIKMLLNVFDSLKEIVIHTVNLEFRKDGMELMYMTPEQTAMVWLKLNESNFFKYACEQTHTIGIRLQDVIAAVRACRDTKLLRIEIPSDGASLVFYATLTNGQREVCFTLASLDTDDTKLKIPHTSWSNSIQMPIKELKENVRTLDFAARSVRIQWDNGVLTFSANEENKDVKITIDTKKPPEDDDEGAGNGEGPGHDDASAVDEDATPSLPQLAMPAVPQLPPLMGAPAAAPSIRPPPRQAPVDAWFSIRYLKWFTKTEGLGNSMVHLMLKPDFPLCLTYQVGASGELTFVLNPSIPDEEEDEDDDSDKMVPYDSTASALYD